MSGDFRAIISDSPLTRLTQNTCFKVNYATIKAQDNKMIIGLDFSESVFIHAILHSQDDLTTVYPYYDTNLEYFYQNYEIYIGDSSSYSDN